MRSGPVVIIATVPRCIIHLLCSTKVPPPDLWLDHTVEKATNLENCFNTLGARKQPLESYLYMQYLLILINFGWKLKIMQLFAQNASELMKHYVPLS